MKLMILDGNSLVNRAFYGIRMLTAPDGTPTNAVYGFLSILQRLLDEESPDALCVTFDVPAPTFRHKRYAAYKAGRRPMPEELARQIPLLKEVLDAMDIPRRELSGWEADDLLGTISLRAGGSGWECVVVSGDKDALQLVDEHVRVLNVKTRLGQSTTTVYTPESFREEYGFEPGGMVDLKALMGDSSDNLPGVPGIGEKTALELIRRFGSLDGVYEHLEDAAIKPAVRKKLEAGRESAYESYELATIARNAPVDYAPESWVMPRTGEIYELFRRLSFTKFMEKWGLRPESGPEEGAPAQVSGCCTSRILTSPRELEQCLDESGEQTLYLWWEEESGDLLFTYDLSESENVAALLSRRHYAGDYAAAMGKILDPARKKAGHHVKNLLRRALEQGVEADGFVFDSALAAYLLDATAGSYELETLTLRYGGFTPYTAGQAQAQSSLFDGEETVSEAERVAGMASRAAAVAALEETLRPLLREMGVEELFDGIEMPLCKVLAEMECRGFLVDREALRHYGESLNAGIERSQRFVWDCAGHEFNINSPKQLGTVLFQELGLPGGKKTKTGYSTGAEVLEKLREDYPIVQGVLDFRELSKLKSTYADGLLKVIAPDGRIHTTFQMTVTDTGRLSSREPNLHNIPVRRESGALLRRMFVAGEGNVLVDADYSQIELRLLAHISGDENMRAAFLSGQDIHTATASQVFGVPPEEVTPELRRRAKAVNFGIVYGISAFSLSQDLGVYVNEAKDYMDAYFARFSGVRDYQKAVVEQGREQGYVETLFHRRRNLPELRARDFPTRSFGERVALNMPIQGTAADVIKLAMVNVQRRLKAEGLQGRLILQVHDELIVECPEQEGERVARVLTEEMESAVRYSVPLVAEARQGHSWADAH